MSMCIGAYQKRRGHMAVNLVSKGRKRGVACACVLCVIPPGRVGLGWVRGLRCVAMGPTETVCNMNLNRGVQSELHC